MVLSGKVDLPGISGKVDFEPLLERNTFELRITNTVQAKAWASSPNHTGTRRAIARRVLGMLSKEG